MNTLIHDEKFIRNSYFEDDATFHLAYNLFLFHFTVIDAIEKTSHCKAINYLYQTQNSKYTKQRIASETFSNVKSLLLNRKKYADYFYFFYHYVKNNHFTAESAITSLR
ncbi:MAG: hypothetical protein HDP28_01330 [Clostridia bacterium]|nr:hypothetical protein [Clostridia bacterium]